MEGTPRFSAQLDRLGFADRILAGQDRDGRRVSTYDLRVVEFDGLFLGTGPR